MFSLYPFSVYATYHTLALSSRWTKAVFILSFSLYLCFNVFSLGGEKLDHEHEHAPNTNIFTVVHFLGII